MVIKLYCNCKEAVKWNKGHLRDDVLSRFVQKLPKISSFWQFSVILEESLIMYFLL